MRGTRWTIVGGLLAGGLAAEARAEPAVLYVPDQDIELHPLNIALCSGLGGDSNSALGCVGVPNMQVVPPYPDVAGLRATLAVALDAYDVHVADQRPPEYLAYTMLLVGTDPEPASESFTCSAGGINCGARDRNDIIRVFGSTAGCPVSDPLLTSLYAFGRASGLEGVDDPLDAMFYVPDFGMGSSNFLDACQTIVHQIGFDDAGMQVMLPLECTSLDHPTCPADLQNSHADLLEFYGPRVVDVDPPELTNLVPGDGAYVPEGGDLVLDVDISDADPVVGGRWTIFSTALEPFVPDGVINQCTNDVCMVDWGDATPLKATDSDWRMVLSGLPGGIYEVTFEASDFHGNDVQSDVMVIQVGGDPPPETTTDGPADSGSPTSGMSDTTTGPGNTSVFTTSLDGSGGVGVGPGPGPGPEPGGESSDGTGGGAQDDDGLVDHGCSCRTSSGAGWSGALLLLLAARRRRCSTMAGHR